MRQIVSAAVCLLCASWAGAQSTSRCEGIEYLEPPAASPTIALDHVEGQAVVALVGSPRELGATGICVLLFQRGNETPLATGMTNEGGQFALPRPAPGSYVLLAALDPIDDLAVPLQISDATPAQELERGLLLRIRTDEDHRRSSASVIGNLALRRELSEMVGIDQVVRNARIEAGLGTSNSELESRMATIDARNSIRLVEIVETYGWPGADLVGLDGADDASLILQHASYDVQKELFPGVEAGYREGLVSGANYALLLDRILWQEGKPQVYGSQARPVEEWIDGEPALAPIDDEANVDRRRAEVELPPLAEYREQLRRLYFPDR